MKMILSYGIKITGHKRIFDDTVAIYRDAVEYIINIANESYDIWKEEYSLKIYNAIEKLIHNTKGNKAICDFDKRFYKFPSYLRRAAVADAVGAVKSFRSNCKNWEESKSPDKGKPPRLNAKTHLMPALYKDGNFKRTGEYAAKIKIYHQKDWAWLSITLRKSDADYIRKNCSSFKELSPVLMKRNKSYEIRLSFENHVTLTDKQNMIVAVDLGVTNAAAMCAMLPDGTVTGRKFISFPVEEDHLRKSISYTKKAQRSGSYKTPKLWAIAKGINHDISIKTAKAIVAFAEEVNADVIVMEHLDMQGKMKGSKKQRLHLWRKKEVLEIAASLAHKAGMRISTVCAWNTSRLAFDGSGRVKRGKEIDRPYGIVQFQSKKKGIKGKEYSADLNAAYNIGARYYIRTILKSLSVTVRLRAEAKVPSVRKRSTCVLSDLISLNAELAPLAA